MRLLLGSGAVPDAATAAGGSTGKWGAGGGERRLLCAHCNNLSAVLWCFHHAVRSCIASVKPLFSVRLSQRIHSKPPSPAPPPTALHRAAWMGHIDVVQALLAAGATPGLQDADGQTALHKAVQRGHSAVAAVLLSAAPGLADVQDKRGRLAADLVPG